MWHQNHKPSGGSKRGERGAALVEFAIIVPVFMVMILGIVSGGAAYNRKISLNNAVREASRYGATLSFSASLPTNAGTVATWLDAIEQAFLQASTGDISLSDPSASICVAYVDATSGITTAKRWPAGTTSSTPCFTDSLSQTRVQVTGSRSSPIELGFNRIDAIVSGRAVTLFEAK